ncbi:MAG: hypothetical protein LUG58_09000, partial [Clostridiales bacterium]|nr:hypothetical protein [Clostridiales bacterium]
FRLRVNKGTLQLLILQRSRGMFFCDSGKLAGKMTKTTFDISFAIVSTTYRKILQVANHTVWRTERKVPSGRDCNHMCPPT